MGQFRWRGQDRRVVWGIVLLLLLRFVSAATINLSPQEAYYWNYSIHPDLSYLDHPPMVAWVVRAGTLLLGKSEIGVRIGGLWLVVVSTWLINALGRLWFSRRAGLWAALLFAVIPVYCAYGPVITPDVPLICFWLLTIYLVSIAVLKDRPSAWYWAGVALGFAMLSKYTPTNGSNVAARFARERPRLRSRRHALAERERFDCATSRWAPARHRSESDGDAGAAPGPPGVP
jgi:dolichol-phosphate mannosyltransferase